MEIAAEGRSARKHRAIKEAASTVFLTKGYLGTSMGDIAKLAEVSKQTIYHHFADKETLFTEIVLSTADEVDAMVQLVADVPAITAAELEAELTALARTVIHAIMRPRVLRFRRLVIANAGRFPDLGAAWYRQGFERVLTTLATTFSGLADRNLLKLEDPLVAADHFAGLLLGIPVNRAMFHGTHQRPTDTDLDRYAATTAHTFLAAYRHEGSKDR